jgi:hypothetical protein
MSNPAVTKGITIIKQKEIIRKKVSPFLSRMKFINFSTI